MSSNFDLIVIGAGSGGPSARVGGRRAQNLKNIAAEYFEVCNER